MSRDNDQRGKQTPYVEMSHDNGHKRSEWKQQIAAPKSFCSFSSQK